MRDRYALAKLTAFVILAVAYLTASIIACLTLVPEAAGAVMGVGFFIVGGMAFGIGVME